VNFVEGPDQCRASPPWCFFLTIDAGYVVRLWESGGFKWGSPRGDFVVVVGGGSRARGTNRPSRFSRSPIPFFKVIGDTIAEEAASGVTTSSCTSGEFDVAKQQNQVEGLSSSRRSWRIVPSCPCDSRSIGPASRKPAPPGSRSHAPTSPASPGGQGRLAHSPPDNYGRRQGGGRGHDRSPGRGTSARW